MSGSKRINCWDYFNCGREKGGINSKELGVCPVSYETSADTLNGGTNGGRICWVIADLCCGFKFRCSRSRSKDPCYSCEFRYKVMQEEGLINISKATGRLLEMHAKSNGKANE